MNKTTVNRSCLGRRRQTFHASRLHVIQLHRSVHCWR